jgi:hypothetical protein
MKRRSLYATIANMLTLGPLPPANIAPQSMESDGAMVPYGALVNALNTINGYSIAEAGTNFQTSAAATITLTNLQGLTQRLTNGGAVTVTLDSAYNIVNALAFPFLGMTWQFTLVDNAATTVATPTLSDTAVTLAGTTTVTSGGSRVLQGVITQMSSSTVMPFTAGSTFTSIAQVGSTNNFTVTLGTNALTPVVGTLFPITVTTGTLPSGYYPINKVTSATSFVIATPPGTVWTATAATLAVATSIAPVPTAAAPVYSPLVTITGMYGMAAGVIVV